MTEPHPSAPGLAAGVTEDLIRNLVHTFYARVRQDPLLGPIFDAKVHDWDDHLAKLCRFWSSVTLLTGTYKGRPMPVHAALPDLADRHFARWLELFAQTAADVCPPAAAALFIDRSQRIGYSLSQGIAMHRESLASMSATS